MTPPLPAPVPDPIAGGSWLATSGNTQTSGVVEAEQAEYTQWLTIDYHRNPHFTTRTTGNQTFNLTSFSGDDQTDVYSTRLHIVITAHTSCKFVTGAFNASSYYQPQVLELQPLPYDRFGNTYGDTSGTSAGNYVFGPQGKIVTTQPYVRRTTKTANDVEYSLTQMGTNFATGDMWIQQHPNWSHQWRGGNFAQGDYRSYVPVLMDISRTMERDYYIRCDRRHQINGDDVYGMVGGGYTTSSEMGYDSSSDGLANLINIIEMACARLSASDYKIRYVGDEIPVNSQGSVSIAEDDKLPINPYYDSSRHSY